MPFPLCRTDLEIRRELEAASLSILSDDAADLAEEEGHLDGNQHYQDLRTASWDDVRFALEREDSLIRAFSTASSPAEAEAAFDGDRDPDDEREALWGLDVGVASAVTALGALGAQTTLSCNGGAFGNPHFRDAACVRFYPAGASIEALLSLAERADVGLVQEGGCALLYARSIMDLQTFARLALGSHR
jgi:hypothetical protein